MLRFDSIPFQFKIKAQRHLLAITLLVLLTVLSVSILIFESRLSDSVMTDIKATSEGAGNKIERQIQERLSEYRDDLRFLHATPPVSGLSHSLNNSGDEPFDSTSYSKWKQRLEVIFVAFLQNNTEYQQLRIIDTTEQGMELVRADRIGGEIKVIKDVNLQSKSDRDYFSASAQLSDGEVYMSSLSLNREFGKIDFPYRPMLRLSLPIFDDKGNRFGFLIVNIHAEQLLSTLESIVTKPNQLMLTDSEGYYLITPNENHKFSRDLDPTKTWDRGFKTLNVLSDNFTEISAIEDKQGTFFSFTEKIVVSGDISQGYVLAHVLTPKNYVDNLAMDRRASVYTFLVAVTAILLFVLNVFNRNMKKNQQLSEAKAQSAAIVGGSQDVIIGITKAAVVTSWNRSAELLFNYNEEYAKGKSMAELGLFQDIELHDIIANLSQSNMQQNTDVTIKTEQGIVYLSLSFSAIIDFSSDINGVAIIARDVTKEHIADMKIKQSNAELEEKVASRTKELQKNSHLKSAFISSISHEMRTPLNGIIGTLKLVKNESLSDSQKRYLEMTEVSVNNLSALINDVLDLSKIEAGKLDVDFKAFNPIRLIQNLSCNMAIKAQENGLEFIVDVADLHCQSIVSDAHRFSQILSNLISNAIKFTESGYVKVSASSEVCDDGQLILHCSVSDSGVGIAEHNKDKLFTAFTQEYTAVASKYGGTGLGLAICRQLVGLLNGEIDFTSEKDKGSTFNFSISVPQADCKKQVAEPILQGKFCLVLVPNIEVYRSIERMIQSYSGEVLKPHHYEQWLSDEHSDYADISSDANPDFIIIDQHDPRLVNLDRKWSQWQTITKQTPEVFVLNKISDKIQTLKNLMATRLNKPLLGSEFLQKTSLAAGPSTSINNNLSQTDTDDDFNICAENIAKIAGARILVVDDNEINLEVAKGMLSSLPIEIDQATNGQEALDLLQTSLTKNRFYHCILMDCQMPILNGYDTSRKIREGILGVQYTTIPIIAMTANAMLGEREKCLEAGMNDYTTKPINLDLLVSKIIKWTSSVYDAEINSPETPFKAVDSETSGFETSTFSAKTLVWDKQSALTRLMSNESLLLKICRIFMDTSPEKIDDLGKSIQDENLSMVIKLTHSLKGSAGDLGAVDLHQLFSSMEQIAKTSNIEELQQCYQIVLTSYAAFIAILEKELSGD